MDVQGQWGKAGWCFFYAGDVAVFGPADAFEADPFGFVWDVFSICRGNEGVSVSIYF